MNSRKTQNNTHIESNYSNMGANTLSTEQQKRVEIRLRLSKPAHKRNFRRDRAMARTLKSCVVGYIF